MIQNAVRSKKNALRCLHLTLERLPDGLIKVRPRARIRQLRCDQVLVISEGVPFNFSGFTELHQRGSTGTLGIQNQSNIEGLAGPLLTVVMLKANDLNCSITSIQGLHDISPCSLYQ